MAFAGTCHFTSGEKSELLKWLQPSWTAAASPSYLHLHLVEDTSQRASVTPLLLRYIHAAHQDARQFFIRAYSRKLDPRGFISAATKSYPADVEDLTLAGFFGEVLSGLIAEVYEPHGYSWLVPAFCFRAHSNIFRELMKAAEEGRKPKRAVGRLGDDCVAFSIPEGDTVAAVLLCEAKCSHGHNASLISDGHASLSATTELQIEYYKIIEILRDRGAPGDAEWIMAIQTYRDSADASKQKFDMLTYSHGQAPVKKPTWISVEKKHEAHTSAAPLVAAEVHLDGIRGFISTLYKQAFP